MTEKGSQNISRKSSRKYILSSLMMMVIVLVTLTSILRKNSLTDVWAAISTADWRWVIFGFSLMLVHQLCVAEIIRLLLVHTLKVRPPYQVCLNTAWIGFYFNNITPSASGGQPMEVYYLHRCRADIAGSSIIFIAITVFYNLALLIYGTLGLVLEKDLILPCLYGMKYVLVYGYLINFGLLFFCLWLLLSPKGLKALTLRIIYFLDRKKVIKRTEHWLEKTEHFFTSYEGTSLNLIRDAWLMLRLLFFHLIQVGALNLVPYTAGKALGACESTLWPTFATGSVLNMAAAGFPTPGATGVTESGFVAMFQNLFPNGQVVPVMLLCRFINFYGILILSAIMSIRAFSQAGRTGNRMHHLRRRKKTKPSTEPKTPSTPQ